MASIGKRPNGTRAAFLFVAADGNGRKSVRLGKVPKKAASRGQGPGRGPERGQVIG